MTHQLRVEQWRKFFLLCAEILGPGDGRMPHTQSYCTFTVFHRLNADVHYWQHGLPLKEEIGETAILDGGVWGQPFDYDSLAHIVIPRIFGVEYFDDVTRSLEYRELTQNIDALSVALEAEGIAHRLTEAVLEIKCY